MNSNYQYELQFKTIEPLLHLTINSGRVVEYDHGHDCRFKQADLLRLIHQERGPLPGAPGFRLTLGHGNGCCQFDLTKGYAELVTGGIAYGMWNPDHCGLWHWLLDFCASHAPWIPDWRPVTRPVMPQSSPWIAVFRNLQFATLSDAEIRMVLALERDLAWALYAWSKQRK